MNREDAIKVINDSGEISYAEMDWVIGEIELDALTEDATITLMQYKDSGPEVLYPLLKILGMQAFTDDGLSKIAEKRK